MFSQTEEEDKESGPLAIYDHGGEDNPWPIMVGVVVGEVGKGILMTTKPHIDLQSKAGLSLHGRYGLGTIQASMVALACIRSMWEHWVQLILEGKSGTDKDLARKRAFSSHIILDVLTAGQKVGGCSSSPGICLSLLSMIFGVKFRQDTVVTGDLSASGLILDIGSPGDKADIVAKGGKERLVLPLGSKLKVEKEREGDSRLGDRVALLGVLTIWEALDETIQVNGSVSKLILNR